MNSAAIFDLDGTLVNSVYDLAAAVNFALKKFGLPEHPTESYYHFVGNGVPKLIERAAPNFEDKAALKEVFDEYYAVHCMDLTKPYDGIYEALEKLKGNGVKICVASNKPDNFSRIIVEHFFPHTFDVIMGSIGDVPKKPAPDIVFNIEKRLGGNIGNRFFAGDSDVDIYTAKNAGFKSIGCLWGFRTKDELENAGADFLAEKPAELADIIISE